MMKVIAAHTVKKSLSNPLTAKSVIDTFTSHNRLAIDNQVSSSELLNLVGDFAGFDATTMQSFTLPTFTKPIFVAGVGNQDFEILQTGQGRGHHPGLVRRDAGHPQGQCHADHGRPDDLRLCRHQRHLPRRPPRPHRRPQRLPTTTTAAPTTTAGATPRPRPPPPSPNEPRSWDPRPCSG